MVTEQRISLSESSGCILAVLPVQQELHGELMLPTHSIHVVIPAGQTVIQVAGLFHWWLMIVPCIMYNEMSLPVSYCNKGEVIFLNLTEVTSQIK